MIKVSALPAVQPPHVLDFISHSEQQTMRIGQRLSEQFHPGDLILLFGNIGVGKTHLVKGMAQGLGSSDLVTSPSFVLANEYVSGPAWRHMPLYHVDLYRLTSHAELIGMGLEDMIGSDGVCFIEWAEHAEGWLPNEHLSVHLQHLDETKRVIRLVPQGERYNTLVEAFKEAAFGSRDEAIRNYHGELRNRRR